MDWDDSSPPRRGQGPGVGGIGRVRDDLPATRRIGGPTNVRLARRLRNDPTQYERKLWGWLRTLRRTHRLHFRRQIPIGRFVADFGCHSARLLIELDGPFHDAERDRGRDTWFAEAGYRVLRFSNEAAAYQWDRVVTEIAGVLGVSVAGQGWLLQTPTPDPSPQGGGEV
ncbi:MAG TPA: endonuclease domain-containing protein [Caulobacteraceae bacterium]|nr:endonuclease domain-containing protein [Caulobacteraceae bacterium]